jgi:hypothetical protein
MINNKIGTLFVNGKEIKESDLGNLKSTIAEPDVIRIEIPISLENNFRISGIFEIPLEKLDKQYRIKQ